MSYAVALIYRVEDHLQVKVLWNIIVAIMPGAILSRAVTGASPFIPTVAAGLVKEFTHRLLALACIYFPARSKLIKGKEWTLYKDGKVNKLNLKRNDISKGDLPECISIGANVQQLHRVDKIIIEKSGYLSIIKKKS